MYFTCIQCFRLLSFGHPTIETHCAGVNGSSELVQNLLNLLDQLPRWGQHQYCRSAQSQQCRFYRYSTSKMRSPSRLLRSSCSRDNSSSGPLCPTGPCIASLPLRPVDVPACRTRPCTRRGFLITCFAACLLFPCIGHPFSGLHREQAKQRQPWTIHAHRFAYLGRWPVLHQCKCREQERACFPGACGRNCDQVITC